MVIDALLAPDETVTVPLRELVPVFAANETEAPPLPVPLDEPEKPDPDVAVVQPQESALVVIGIGIVCAVLSAVIVEARLIATVHAGVAPLCTTLTEEPLTLIVAVRSVVDVFGCAVKSRAPEPVPTMVLGFAVEAWGKEIQLEFADALQLHVLGAVTGIVAGSGVALRVAIVGVVTTQAVPVYPICICGPK
jgi:hypothetical protein